MQPALDLGASLAAAHRRYEASHPRSAALFERARAVLPGGNTRSVLDMRPFPFRTERAEGYWLHDVDGNSYRDFLGDYSAGLLGHDPGVVAEAVRAALQRGWSFGSMHVDEIRFAEGLCERFPSIDQVRFTNSGTEANLMAIQLARHHTGRERIVVARGGYHGGLLYFGHGGEALLAPFDFVRIPFNDAAAAEAAIDDTVAAVLIEPMLGSAGCIPATPDFLSALRRRCDAVGALLIFDEVMTSRMSAGGVQSRIGVVPDLTTLGKYLAGGMTFGAFGGRADVMAAFDPRSGGELTHGGTFNNNVVTMAAGAAVLGELLAPQVLDEHYQRGERLRQRIAAVLAEHSLPMCVTGIGSLMTIHTVAGPVSSPADLEHADPVLKELVHLSMLERGIYFAGRGYIALSLLIDEPACDAFVEALTDTVTTISTTISTTHGMTLGTTDVVD